MTSDDLFDMYNTNYPHLKRDDFERIVEEYHQWYGFDDEEETLTQTFKPDGKETDKEDFIF